MTLSLAVANLLPRIISVKTEDIQVRQDPVFVHQKVRQLVEGATALGLAVTAIKDDQVQILTDDYILLAFPHIFLLWNVLIFDKAGKRWYFSVFNSSEILTVLKEHNIISRLR